MIFKEVLKWIYKIIILVGIFLIYIFLSKDGDDEDFEIKQKEIEDLQDQINNKIKDRDQKLKIADKIKDNREKLQRKIDVVKEKIVKDRAEIKNDRKKAKDIFDKYRR